MKKTLYEILDVEEDASAPEIAAAYNRAKAAQEQSAIPDPNRAIVLREAYLVLSHVHKRATYDAGLLAKEIAAATAAEQQRNRRKKFLLGVLIVVVLIGGLATRRWMQRHQAAQAPDPALAAVVAVPAPVTAAPVTASAPIAPAPAPAIGRTMSAEEIYASVAPSVARVNVSDDRGNLIGTGSAVVIRPGEVITNCHVAKMGPNLELSFRSEKVSASISIADEFYDLCLLQASGLNAAPVAIADLKNVQTGGKVYAIGAPQGLELTISEGIISSLRDIPDVGTVIQTSAAISPGSSGGGLFDSSGRLIGITTFQSRSGQNLNFAVPAEWIRSMSTRSGGGIGGMTMSQQQN